MYAYDINRSRIGPFGFDTINLYTNDDVYCSGFEPKKRQIQLIGNFTSQIKSALFSEEPMSLFITYKEGRYLADTKAHINHQPVFASTSGRSIEEVLRTLKHKLIIDSIFPSESITHPDIYAGNKEASYGQLPY